ncbi:beta family protein [Pectobacterium polaris]|uniref:beta family protein n=1 Tax=Pectobacterium polaris TaxID=2042057 RepID=UPI000BB36C4F|nr:beta family protein [Pectobacterium polaris]ASY75468.1 beta family protein [Pectobacterium polaris]
MNKYVYFPVIKTRDAELKAMSKLPERFFDKILPIYELTKSRKVSIAPDGDIHRRMKSIREIQGGRPFILDLTSSDKYINEQIRQLVDERDGYYEWRYFINIYSDLNIIPMIHIYDEEDFDEVKKFVSEMSSSKELLAVRLPFDLKDHSVFIDPIYSSLNDNSKVIIIIDAGQVDESIASDVKKKIKIACNSLNKFNDKIEGVIITMTSFPSTPADYGSYNEGEFPILEEEIYREISKDIPVKYGDYASINIQQIEIKGGTFVPRIDVSLESSFIYKRNKRSAGSYELCAQKMLGDLRYKPLNIWADLEISLAAKGNPSGISPSFWIAVRMNYFMCSRVLLRES